MPGPQEGRAISRGVWKHIPSGGTVPGVGLMVSRRAWLEPAGTCGLVSPWARLEPAGTSSPAGRARGQLSKVTLAQRVPAESPSGQCRVTGRGLALPHGEPGGKPHHCGSGTGRPPFQTCQ